jgi:uncharacterized Rossmann fold enzyme
MSVRVTRALKCAEYFGAQKIYTFGMEGNKIRLPSSKYEMDLSKTQVHISNSGKNFKD